VEILHLIKEYAVARFGWRVMKGKLLRMVETINYLFLQ